MNMNYHIIHSKKAAEDFAEGFPIGNGRLGGMVLCRPAIERIALNHDLLWRRSFTCQDHKTREDIDEIASLCKQGEYLKAELFSKRTVPYNGYYTNPFAPVGDLYIHHVNCGEFSEYERSLNMETGVATVKYNSECKAEIVRESFASWKEGLLVTHITSSHCCMLNGEVSLSRLGDAECEVSGFSKLGMVGMDGVFEEGLRFSVRTKVLQRAGRLKGGRKQYLPYEKQLRGAWGSEFEYSFDNQFDYTRGCSTCFDHAAEVLILTAIVVEDETTDGNTGFAAEQKLEKFNDINIAETLMNESIADHQTLYHSMQLKLNGKLDLSSEQLLETCITENKVLPEMAETLFNFSRYLSISAGRSQPQGQFAKAPMNLQGIWLQDLRPAWDCDYHLDLNVEMAYWAQNAYGLESLMLPMLEWVERMSPSGRKHSYYAYGTDALIFGGCCDCFGCGNGDNVGFLSTPSLSAWLCQVLWQQWVYEKDSKFLKRLYVIMVEVAKFFEKWLEEKDGFLYMPFGTSPEMPIFREGICTFLASTSSFDMELIFDLFGHLIEASEIMGEVDAAKRYRAIFSKLPLPNIDKNGAIQEWRDEFEEGAPEHRHRSSLVGLIPGSRISLEATPEYAQAAYKLLQKRHSHGSKGSTSFTFALDGQILARLEKPEEVYNQLLLFVKGYLLPNLLSVTNNYDGKHNGIEWFLGKKVFQLEAQVAIGAAILEMIFQSRQGVIKFLPALTKNYSEGKLVNAPAENGFFASFEWENSKIFQAEISSKLGEICKIKLPNDASEIIVSCKGKKIETQNCNKIYSFETMCGAVYKITFVR